MPNSGSHEWQVWCGCWHSPRLQMESQNGLRLSDSRLPVQKCSAARIGEWCVVGAGHGLCATKNPSDARLPAAIQPGLLPLPTFWGPLNSLSSPTLHQRSPAPRKVVRRRRRLHYESPFVIVLLSSLTTFTSLHVADWHIHLQRPYRGYCARRQGSKLCFFPADPISPTIPVTCSSRALLFRTVCSV